MIAIIATLATAYVLEIYAQTQHSRIKLPWYEIEDWEVDTCSKWGGRTEAEKITTEQQPESYGDMSITIQARKTKSRNETLYRVSYYLESFSATTDYTIRLINKQTGQQKEITHGTLEPGIGTTDYWVQNLKESYTTAEIKYYKGTVIAPIVEMS